MRRTRPNMLKTPGTIHTRKTVTKAAHDGER
jgi:hypothetical protein